jgi:histone H3/H4
VDTDREILIVISKLKNYIRAKSSMNTAGSVAEALSDRVRSLCDQAIENARKDGRKTVMDRDIPAVGASASADAMHS